MCLQSSVTTEPSHRVLKHVIEDVALAADERHTCCVDLGRVLLDTSHVYWRRAQELVQARYL